MPNRSVILLQEGLEEIGRLAEEAKRKNPVLYENASYTALDVVLLEAEDDKEGFLDRTAAAIEKVKKAGQAGVKELSDLEGQLAQAGMQNSETAVNKARTELEKSIPGQGFMTNLKSLSGGAMSALFGKDDDPVEKVTEIVSDATRYKQMLSSVMQLVTEMLDQIKPEAAVEQAEEDQGSELDPEAEKEWIEQFKSAIMDATIDKILNSEDDPFPKIREAFPDFNERAILAAIKKSVKPGKWFAGLKKVSGALGIGLGGDLPFKKYGLKIDGVLDDVSVVQISEFQKITTAIKPDSTDQKIIQTTTSATSELGDLQQDLPALQAAEDQQAAAPPPAETPGSPGTEPEPGASAADETGPPSAEPKYLKVVQNVSAIEEPETAAEKLQQLLAAGFSINRHLSLYDLLQEKVVRYNDVVAALGDHLPSKDEEKAVAVKQLADEMKVELGSEFDIVGIPAVDTLKIQSAIESLRALIATMSKEDAEATIDHLEQALDSAGLGDEISPDEVEGFFRSAVGVEDAVQDALDDDEGTALSDDSIEQVGDELKDYVDELEKGEEVEEKAKKEKRDPGTWWELGQPASRGRKYGAKGKGEKSKKIQLFATEKGAEKYSLRTEVRIALSHMRGYILRETSDFRKVSFMSPSEVISEFYRLGGTNRKILSEIHNNKKAPISDQRWMQIAGLKK